MNPGQFNRRIAFFEIDSTQNPYGGSTVTFIPLIVTWGALKPLRSYNQQTQSAGATPLLADVSLIIRYRTAFKPTENMMFRDISDPNGPLYAIKTISSYYPGTKQIFENNQETAYQNNLFVYMTAVKQDNSYINLN